MDAYIYRWGCDDFWLLTGFSRASPRIIQRLQEGGGGAGAGDSGMTEVVASLKRELDMIKADAKNEIAGLEKAQKKARKEHEKQVMMLKGELEEAREGRRASEVRANDAEGQLVERERQVEELRKDIRYV